MNLLRLMYPEHHRQPQWLRWVRISCRSLHLLAIAGLVGGHVFDAPKEQLLPWLGAALITGGALMGTYLYGSFTWIRQIRGLAMLFKLLLILLIPLVWDHRVWVLAVVILVSGYSSHMPGQIRDWTPFSGEPRPVIRFGKGGKGKVKQAK
jgi:hypothetical protein